MSAKGSFTLLTDLDDDGARLDNERTRELVRRGFVYRGTIAEVSRAGETRYALFFEARGPRVARVTEHVLFGASFTYVSLHDRLDGDYGIVTEVVPDWLRAIGWLLRVEGEKETGSLASAPVDVSARELFERHEERVSAAEVRRGMRRKTTTPERFVEALNASEVKEEARRRDLKRGIVLGALLLLGAMALAFIACVVASRPSSVALSIEDGWVLLPVLVPASILGFTYRRLKTSLSPFGSPNVETATASSELVLAVPRRWLPRRLFQLAVFATGLVVLYPLSKPGASWLSVDGWSFVFAAQWLLGLRKAFDPTNVVKRVGVAVVDRRGIRAGGTFLRREAIATAILQNKVVAKSVLRLFDVRGRDLGQLEGAYARLVEARDTLDVAPGASRIVLQRSLPLPGPVRTLAPVLGIACIALGGIPGIGLAVLASGTLFWLTVRSFSRVWLGGDGLLVGSRFLPWGEIAAATSRAKGRVVRLTRTNGEGETIAFCEVGSANLVIDAWHAASAQARVDEVLAARIRASRSGAPNYRDVDVSDRELSRVAESATSTESLRVRAARALARRPDASTTRIRLGARIVNPAVFAAVFGGGRAVGAHPSSRRP